VCAVINETLLPVRGVSVAATLLFRKLIFDTVIIRYQNEKSWRLTPPQPESVCGRYLDSRYEGLHEQSSAAEAAG
jgi:hypothetical protein